MEAPARGRTRFRITFAGLGDELLDELGSDDLIVQGEETVLMVRVDFLLLVPVFFFSVPRPAPIRVGT